MTKEIWREKWLCAINELTSMKLQNNCKLILAKNGSIWKMIDFINFQSGQFLFGLNYFHYKDENNWIHPIEYEILEDWNNDLEEYVKSIGDDYYGRNLLNYSKWLSIHQKGILAREKLKLVLPEHEKEYLN